MSNNGNSDPNALMDILASAFAPKKRECPYAKMIKGVGLEVRNLIDRLMTNKDISTRKIHLALTRSGASIGRDSISDHRENRCVCGGTQ